MGRESILHHRRNSLTEPQGGCWRALRRTGGENLPESLKGNLKRNLEENLRGNLKWNLEGNLQAITEGRDDGEEVVKVSDRYLSIHPPPPP